MTVSIEREFVQNFDDVADTIKTEYSTFLVHFLSRKTIFFSTIVDEKTTKYNWTFLTYFISITIEIKRTVRMIALRFHLAQRNWCKQRSLLKTCVYRVMRPCMSKVYNFFFLFSSLIYFPSSAGWNCTKRCTVCVITLSRVSVHATWLHNFNKNQMYR